MPQQPSNQFVQGFNNFIQAVNTDIAAAASTIANSLADAAYTQSQAMEAIFDSYAQQFQQFSNAAQNYADIAATRADASAQAAWQATADQFNNWADSRASQAGDAWLDSVRSQMLGDLGKAAGPIGDTIDLGQLAGNVANNNWNGVGKKSAGILQWEKYNRMEFSKCTTQLSISLKNQH